METQNLLDDYTNDDRIAADFGVCKRTVQRWRRQGKLPQTTDPGGLTHIEELRAKLETNRVEIG